MDLRSETAAAPAAIGEQTEARIGPDPIRYHYDLATNLISRDIRLRYKGSILGMLWSLAHPFSVLLVYSFLFVHVISLNIPNYVPFLVIGVLPWNWFSASLDFSTGAIIDNRDIVKKAMFPMEMLLVATITSNLLIFALGLIVLLIFLVATGIVLTPAALLLPAIIAIQYCLTLGLGLTIATLNVYFRDTRHLLAVLLFAWLFLTPVFYDSAAVPQSYAQIYQINPMVHIINSYREILLFGRIPDFSNISQVAVIAVAVLMTGLTVFRKRKGSFAEQL